MSSMVLTIVRLEEELAACKEQLANVSASKCCYIEKLAQAVAERYLATEELEVVKRALKFYADADYRCVYPTMFNDGHFPEVCRDKGRRAREALGLIGLPGGSCEMTRAEGGVDALTKAEDDDGTT